MNTQEVAELLGVHELTVHRWRQSDTGPPYIRLSGSGKLIRYDRDSLLAWIRQNQHITQAFKTFESQTAEPE